MRKAAAFVGSPPGGCATVRREPGERWNLGNGQKSAGSGGGSSLSQRVRGAGAAGELLSAPTPARARPCPPAPAPAPRCRSSLTPFSPRRSADGAGRARGGGAPRGARGHVWNRGGAHHGDARALRPHRQVVGDDVRGHAARRDCEQRRVHARVHHSPRHRLLPQGGCLWVLPVRRVCCACAPCLAAPPRRCGAGRGACRCGAHPQPLAQRDREIDDESRGDRAHAPGSFSKRPAHNTVGWVWGQNTPTDFVHGEDENITTGVGYYTPDKVYCARTRQYLAAALGITETPHPHASAHAHTHASPRA